jgi:Fungal specific transcription factor domain
MNEEQRRLTFLRENVESLSGEKSALEQVLWNLKNSTEDESFEILRRIRDGTDPHSLVQQIQASRLLAQVKGDTPPSSSSPPCQCSPPLLTTCTFLQTVLDADPVSPTTASPNTNLDRLVHTITRASAPEILDIVSRLRRRDPVTSDGVGSGNVLHPSGRIPAESNYGAEDGVDDIEGVDGVASGFTTVSRARPIPGNALTPMLGHPYGSGTGAPDAHTPPDTHEYRWTTVTDDRELISHLLHLYFMWQHSFFQSFPEDLFRKDYAAGRTKYCSRVLVNAICAAGCLLSDRPEARGDPSDPETAGASFFEEGMRLLNQSDRASIPTTAGVYLLSHVEGNRGRLGAMWGLVGRSARMALDLNLHLRNDKTSFHDLSPGTKAEEAGRTHAFWGCFISDQ